MGWNSILAKDAREHGLALLTLTLALLGAFALALARQRSGEFSMSSFQVVHFALLTFLPLNALILGNRLIVREYTGGTRQFMESLPLKPATAVIVKFVTGWLYLLATGAILIGVAAIFADQAEYVDGRYLMLLLAKCSAVLSVIWSVVFFASLTGKFRLLIYLVAITALFYLFYLPDFDAKKLAPVALMDRELFALEREFFPWRQIVETLTIAAAVSLGGFVLALVNEGSVAEQLGKPVSKRNRVAMVILAMAILGTSASLREQATPGKLGFSGDYVARSDSPKIEISYLEGAYQTHAQTTLEKLNQSLNRFRQDNKLEKLPPLQIALNTKFERWRIDTDYTDSVLIISNFVNFNDHDHRMMNTVALHHMMLLLSNSRWDYEPRHWLLDGLSRWWAEGAEDAAKSPHNPEYIARALLAKRSFEADYNPLLAWQTTIDRYEFEAAFALAYTAILYLAEQQGVATLHRLATSYLNEKPGSSSVESVKTILNTDTTRFANITGLPIEDFTRDWLGWLERHNSNPAILSLVNSVPKISGRVRSTRINNVRWLQASYAPLPGYSDDFTGSCVLHHQRTLPFDREESIRRTEPDRQPCITGNVAHRIESPYAAGDRAYVVLEFETERFNRPIRLWADRVPVK